MSSRERFVSGWRSPYDKHSTLSLSTPLQEVCATPGELERLLDLFHSERYFVAVSRHDDGGSDRRVNVSIVLRSEATSEDVLTGSAPCCN